LIGGSPLLHRIWQMPRPGRCAKPCANAVKHPVKSGFHTIVTKAGVRFGSKADIGLPPIDVRFTPESLRFRQ
jgi:hypothetical protein